MLDSSYINVYVRSAWLLLDGDVEKSRMYEQYLCSLINTCQFTMQNLVISLYFLHKYTKNQVNSSDSESNLTIYLVLTSLILSNKTFDDQSYTLKTWNNICNGISKTTTLGDKSKDNLKLVTIDFKLLKSLELHFLSCLNYSLSFLQIDVDDSFWGRLTSVGYKWMNVLKDSVCRTQPDQPEIVAPTSMPQEAPATPSTNIISMPTTVAAKQQQLYGPSPSSNLTTPLSKLTNSPFITPVNSYLSPLTPITPLTEQPLFKKPKYKQMQHSMSYAQQVPQYLQPPYVTPQCQFTFEYKHPQMMLTPMCNGGFMALNGVDKFDTTSISYI